jgi:hypothetical protein
MVCMTLLISVMVSAIPVGKGQNTQPSKKLHHKTNVIQHMQVNQFSKTHDIYTAHSLDQACQTTPHAFCSKFMHSYVADCDCY